MNTSTTLPEGVQFKDISAATDGTLIVDEKQGIVECFAAALGNRDSVGDIIQKGAFVGSLRRRKPRVVWGHDWNSPIGKILEIAEVGPDDPRLSLKMKMHGVGGLYAKMQFNLKSTRGKDAFEDLLFFGEEQEWSIGYKTLDSDFDTKSKSTILREVELYELSPVLHGANNLTSTISIKSAFPSDEEPTIDAVVLKGLAMLKTFADENEDFASELNTADKGGLPSQDFRGEIAGGRGPRRGNMEDLLKYWRPIMKKPGGFRRCLVILADHPELGPLPNMCAWLHHETTGKWPNEGNHHGKSEEEAEVKSNEAFGASADLAKALHNVMETKVVITDATEKTVSWMGEDEVEYEASYAIFNDEIGEKEAVYMFGGKRKKKHPCKDGEPCECDGSCKTEKSLEDDLGEIAEKIGRTISSRNMGKLQQALGLLQEVVGAGAQADVELKSVAVVGGSDDLQKALQIVTTHHNPGSEVTESNGIFRIAIKSEDHLRAVQKVTQHFDAELQEV